MMNINQAHPLGKQLLYRGARLRYYYFLESVSSPLISSKIFYNKFRNNQGLLIIRGFGRTAAIKILFFFLKESYHILISITIHNPLVYFFKLIKT